VPVMRVRAAHGKSAARHPPAHYRQEDHSRELESNEVSQGSCLGRALLPAKPPIPPHQFFLGSGAILSHAVKWSNPRLPPAITCVPKAHFRAVTYLPRRKMLNSSIGKLRAILKNSQESAYVRS
jgi:hypothetical protein